MIKSIRHVGIRVRNMDKMIEFYTGIGLTLKSRTVEYWGDIELEVAKLATINNRVLELIKAKSWWPKNHIAFKVDEMPIFPLVEITLEGPSKIGVRYLRDPEDNWIELVLKEIRK